MKTDIRETTLYVFTKYYIGFYLYTFCIFLWDNLWRKDLGKYVVFNLHCLKNTYSTSAEQLEEMKDCSNGDSDGRPMLKIK